MRITTETSELHVPLIHRYLSQHTSWAKDIGLPLVQRSIDNSLCFGGFIGSEQVAFARVVSDYATFAYLGDVFVLPEHQGRGYSKVLMDAVMAHPSCRGCAGSALPPAMRTRSIALRLYAAAVSPVADGALLSGDVYRVAEAAKRVLEKAFGAKHRSARCDCGRQPHQYARASCTF
ncbi:GNAT family N-acetyltransferase [Xanthomonas prunicola]|uniref:GNAT family N-acetyltransferase n=1 Tax=Xanthomonas prunicola TaxID=2053930 RepID=UPI0031B5DF91